MSDPFCGNFVMTPWPSPTQNLKPPCQNPHNLPHSLQRRRHSHMDHHVRLGFFTSTYEPVVKGMLIYFPLPSFPTSNSLNVLTPYTFLHSSSFSCTFM